MRFECTSITDPSFNDMCLAISSKLTNFDKSKCFDISDLLIAFDYLDFFNNDGFDSRTPF